MTTSTLTAGLPMRPTPGDELRAIAFAGEPSRRGAADLANARAPGIGAGRCGAAQLLGRHQTKPIDAKAEKRVGWRTHGILVIAESDPRLTWPERELVRQLGARLYGRRSEDGR